MGIVTIGIFTPNALGIEGSIVQMLSHGFVSAALFMVVGVVYDRIHSREIATYGGLAERMPVYATVFMLFMLASVGLPGTAGFVGEILVHRRRVPDSTAGSRFFAATGMILGAAYMLWLYRRVIFGALVKDTLQGRSATCAPQRGDRLRAAGRPGDRDGHLSRACSSTRCTPRSTSCWRRSGAARRPTSPLR